MEENRHAQGRAVLRVCRLLSGFYRGLAANRMQQDTVKWQATSTVVIVSVHHSLGKLKERTVVMVAVMVARCGGRFLYGKLTLKSVKKIKNNWILTGHNKDSQFELDVTFMGIEIFYSRSWSCHGLRRFDSKVKYFCRLSTCKKQAFRFRS